MERTSTTDSFYISGGTLPTSALSYVRRRSDDVLYQALQTAIVWFSDSERR